MASTAAEVAFQPGKVVCGRWKVKSKLGAGGCGSVYKVEDLEHKGHHAALKMEPIRDDVDGVLKLEAAVLRKLNDKQNVVRLIQSGKRAQYNFIVISLCGLDLMALKRQSADKQFSEGTIIRIGIQTLYAIKQLHEIGYVHRDVKPGNVMNGASGREARMFYLIDYGMTRSFVVRSGGTTSMAMRKPRKNVLLRGTLRYCSMNVHRRLEQGRVDDLWSMLYMLGELYGGVPWNHTKKEDEITQIKESTPDEEVFKEQPAEFVELAKYLRTLTYQDRPDYEKIYEMFMNFMRREEVSFLDPYDWEPQGKQTKPDFETAIEYSEREKKTKKALPAKEVEYLLFPNVHPRHFKEKKLDL